jgi:hypothetical protein
MQRRIFVSEREEKQEDEGNCTRRSSMISALQNYIISVNRLRKNRWTRNVSSVM